MKDLPKQIESRILIVKTSSLGDIIQAMSVLNYLCARFPQASIDWIVEKRFASIVESHPFIRRTISFDIKQFKSRWWKGEYWKSMAQAIRDLRRYRYDAVFDLQGNCKSGVITLLSRAKEKVGLSWKCVREWPNVLATKTRYSIPFSINIRLQYVRLLQQFFDPELKDKAIQSLDKGVRFKIQPSDQERLKSILSAAPLKNKGRVMVCPGSKWINKQLTPETLFSFLEKTEHALHCSFLLVWGDEEERKICETIQCRLKRCSIVVDRMDLPLWQNLMSEVDLVIAMDSGALHLCGTTSTPSFSVFGPTMPEIFKPVGSSHFWYQGPCPYGKVFEKQCPLLRSCSTGACMREISPDVLFDRFYAWLKSSEIKMNS